MQEEDDELTGFRALMSSHSSLETSSLKEAYSKQRGKRERIMVISNPSVAHQRRRHHRSRLIKEGKPGNDLIISTYLQHIDTLP